MDGGAEDFRSSGNFGHAFVFSGHKHVEIFHVGGGLELAAQIVVNLELTLTFRLGALLAKPDNIGFCGRRETTGLSKKFDFQVDFGVPILVLANIYLAFCSGNDRRSSERKFAGASKHGDKQGNQDKWDEVTKGFVFHWVFSYENSVVFASGRGYPVEALRGKRNPVMRPWG